MSLEITINGYLRMQRILMSWRWTLWMKAKNNTLTSPSFYPEMKESALLWKPSDSLEIIDLGNDYSLVKFLCLEDYDVAVKGRTWFINGNFLTVRKWLPNFRAFKAIFNSVVVVFKDNIEPTAQDTDVSLKAFRDEQGSIEIRQ
ncbi:hypothetical protein Golob_018953, partial [Gossypium lobatum]|nr:hypothetical protein [Gossypium lobatum]